MGFDKGIDVILNSNALRWVLISKSMDYISTQNALQWVLIWESIIFLIVMP